MSRGSTAPRTPRRPRSTRSSSRADESIATLRRDATLAEAYLASGAYPLLTALVDPTTIAAIEPRAAPAAARLTEPAWFLRSLHERGDTTRIYWLIVAGDGGTLIANGSVDTTPIFDIAGDTGGDAGG